MINNHKIMINNHDILIANQFMTTYSQVCKVELSTRSLVSQAPIQFWNMECHIHISYLYLCLRRIENIDILIKIGNCYNNVLIRNGNPYSSLL